MVEKIVFLYIKINVFHDKYGRWYSKEGCLVPTYEREQFSQLYNIEIYT